jgi:diguanylate cyclase (GGDEF)-like protein/PAS domain S-box-containing protein
MSSGDGAAKSARAATGFDSGRFPEGELSRGRDVLRYPARLLVLTLSSVFVGETAVMLALGGMGVSSPLANALVDGLLLSLLVFPVLYFFLLRPLQATYREQAEARASLARSDETYRALLDSTEDSIYLVDVACRYLFINKPHAARLGIAGGDPGERAYADAHSAEESAQFASIIASVVRTGNSERQEYLSARDGKYFLRTFSPVKLRDGRVGAVTVVSKEITELKRLEQRMQALSTKDELTGLYNRRGFAGLADHRLKVAERQGSDVTLLFADLDNLKTVNDTFGHLAGDRTIKDAARILAKACRESDVVARLGGDEFAILLADSALEAAAGIIARIELLVGAHNAAGGGPALSLSVGVGSCTGVESCSIDELIARADAAMYESKLRRHAERQRAATAGRVASAAQQRNEAPPA